MWEYNHGIEKYTDAFGRYNMPCPYFKQMNDVGVCSASKSAFIPSIDKMEHFCFQEAFHACTFFKSSASEERVNEQWQVIPEKHVLSSKI